MGEKQYPPGTVMFYMDQYENNKNKNNESAEDTYDFNYDIDLINELFDPNKPAIKISYFNRPPHALEN
jgi:hypothetical protein